MPDQFSRSRLLLGDEAVKKIQQAFVAVFGVGGVGSYAVEALARGGVGRLALFDSDCVSLSNLNRQIHATHKTIGIPKVEVLRDRILDINPNCRVEPHRCFYTPENAGQFDLSRYDYVIDAVDTVSAKLELIVRAKRAGVPVISCMGAGNKLDPTRFEVADLYQTSICPLARVMRRELRARGVKSLKVVYSKEPPLRPAGESKPGSRPTPGSVPFVPPVAGMILAGEVLKDLAGIGKDAPSCEEPQ